MSVERLVVFAELDSVDAADEAEVAHTHFLVLFFGSKLCEGV